MSPRAVPRATGLTPAQWDLYNGEPDLPTKVAAAAVKAMGEVAFRHLSWDDLSQIAAVGVLEATASFDPTRGGEYERYAFFSALGVVLDSARTEHERYTKARALVRASALIYFRDTQLVMEIGCETEESITAKLHGYTSTTVARAMLEVASMKPTTGGVEEAEERRAAARAGEALRAVMPAPGSVERRVLEMHFGLGMPLTEIAAEMGVDGTGYRTFVRRFHDVLEGMGEGLAARGIRERPAWMQGVSGRALAEDG
jgi:RNA polymerase sigma factor (sigma-70 family)